MSSQRLLCRRSVRGGGRDLYGGIVVTIDGTPAQGSPFASGSPIDITVGVTAQLVNIYAQSPSSENIGRVTIHSPREYGDLFVKLGQGAFPALPNEELINAAIGFAGLGDSGLNPFIHIAGAVSGNMGSVLAGEVFRLQVGGDLKGSVRATNTGESLRRLIVGGSILANDGGNPPVPVLVEATQGSIGQVKAGQPANASGGIFAPVRAPFGNIELVDAVGPVDIALSGPAGIWASGVLTHVRGSSVRANIYVGSNSGLGIIRRITTTAGDLRGSVTCSAFEGDGLGAPDLAIAGDMVAALKTVEWRGVELVVAGSGAASTIEIDSSLYVASIIRGVHGLGPVTIHGNTDCGSEIGSPQGSIGPITVVGNVMGSIGARDSIQSFTCGHLDGYFGGYPDYETVNVPGALRVLGDVGISVPCGAADSPTIRVGTFGSFRVDGLVDQSSRLEFSALNAGKTAYIDGSLQGSVEISGANGSLRGQVVANRSNNSGNEWSGPATAVNTTGQVTSLAPIPYYNQSSLDYGGGAIGLVPFHQYPADSRFIDIDAGANDPLYPPTILQSQFCQVTRRQDGSSTGIHRVGAIVSFYGPVGTPAASPEIPVTVEWNPDADASCDSTTGWVHMGARCGTAVNRGSAPDYRRTVTVWGIQVDRATHMLPSGKYRVRPKLTGDARLRCDNLLADPATAPSVADFSYCFVVLPDCDLDGIADTQPCTTGGHCPADYDDGTGTGTPDDAVTIDDLLYYLGKFDAGDVVCDLDDGSGEGHRDNAVTIDDLLFFLFHFDQGC